MNSSAAYIMPSKQRKQLLTVIADTLSVPLFLIMSKTRKTEAVNARQLFCYILKDWHDYKPQEIEDSRESMTMSAKPCLVEVVYKQRFQELFTSHHSLLHFLRVKPHKIQHCNHILK